MSTCNWIADKDYAVQAAMAPEDLVGLIRNGALPGEQRDGCWYVASPSVVLQLPDDSGSDDALLRVAAYCLGIYVTEGRGELRIPLRFGDPGRAAALDAINSAIASGKAPELPIEVWLNEEHFLVDSSLWVDLGAALVEYATLLGESHEGAP